MGNQQIAPQGQFILYQCEVEQNATIRNFQIVRQEGTRQVKRDIAHLTLAGKISSEQAKQKVGTRA